MSSANAQHTCVCKTTCDQNLFSYVSLYFAIQKAHLDLFFYFLFLSLFINTVLLLQWFLKHDVYLKELFLFCRVYISVNISLFPPPHSSPVLPPAVWKPVSQPGLHTEVFYATALYEMCNGMFYFQILKGKRVTKAKNVTYTWHYAANGCVDHLSPSLPLNVCLSQAVHTDVHILCSCVPPHTVVFLQDLLFFCFVQQNEAVWKRREMRWNRCWK